MKIIQHSEITPADIDEIIRIKSIAWPYPYESQLNWLNNNLKAEDLHLLLQKGNRSVAYLNLIDIKVEVDNKIENAFGIGNVCAIEKGKGYGNELMKLTNQFINKESKPGLLFCKSELVCFYKKFNWVVIEKKKLRLDINNKNIETMFFNFDQKVELLTYHGNSF